MVQIRDPLLVEFPIYDNLFIREMRQQSLVEVLVDREVERPDATPMRRPRSEVPWSRGAAWEAVAQAQRGQR